VPHGKILRIDPAGKNGVNGRYGIPSSNPFVGKPGALGEIYASGMRDPHRFSWDPGGSHRMFLAHIGEHHVEAIYDVRAGDNYGWSEREGSLVFNPSDPCSLYSLPADDAKKGFVYPLAAYDHKRPPGVRCGADLGYAVSGGYVYRGTAVPALQGKYVFGDIVDGRVMYTEERDMRRGGSRATIYQLGIFDESGREISLAIAAGDPRVDLHIGRDGDGELYFLSKANGTVWKVVGSRVRGSSRDVR
jgi:glucose/arabinose dehydrogenase